jgi:E3 ubiquitin-protein ligase HUWE1
LYRPDKLPSFPHSGRLLDAYFSRAFYKQILGRKVDLRDLESVDPE